MTQPEAAVLQPKKKEDSRVSVKVPANKLHWGAERPTSDDVFSLGRQDKSALYYPTRNEESSHEVN